MIPLPPKIDPSVTMMQVEERPSITYADVGGCKEQIEKLREVVELPLLEVSATSTTSLTAARALCQPRHRTPKGRSPVRSPRNGQDSLCPSCRQPNRLDLYPR
jgi:hypothetical protein